jgi:hypothetical protein
MGIFANKKKFWLGTKTQAGQGYFHFHFKKQKLFLFLVPPLIFFWWKP